MRRSLFLLLCAALAACAPHAAPLHGTALVPPEPARDFTLKDQTGASYSLSQDRGRAVVLYFGFTHCADICPQTLALLGRARAKAHIDPPRLRIVMVSVDPKRDTASAMKAFFYKAGVEATGLTGTPEQLRPVYRAYGIAVRPEPHDIGHTDSIFLIDASGRLRELLDPATPLNDVAADLRSIVD